MKNYVKLSLTESLELLAGQYRKVISQISSSKSNIKDEWDNIKVSIIVPTHRIHPDYKQDRIVLKNLITEVQNQLLYNMKKRPALEVIENIIEAEENIDYSRNMDSIILYADRNFGSVVKLPISLEPKIVIDTHFDISPLYKAVQQVRNYYVLVVSQDKVRFMQVLNSVLIEEYMNADFPFESTYYTDDPMKLQQDIYTNNLVKEFFNVADKRMQTYMKEDPLPLVLVGDVKTVSYYREVMDNSCTIIGCVHGSYENSPTHVITKETYPVIEKYIEDKQHDYIADIERAVSGQLLVQHINDIYNEALTGNSETLYVSNNFSLRGRIQDGQLVVNNENDHYWNSIDVVLEIIEKVIKNGGNIVFMDDDFMDQYHGIVLVKRFNADNS